MTWSRVIFSLDCSESAAASKEFPALNQGTLDAQALLERFTLDVSEMFRFISLLFPT